MEKKNILLINDFAGGGGAEAVYNLTAEKLKEDFNIFQYSGFKTFDETTSNPLAYIFSWKHYRHIRKLILEKNVDIIHVHNFRWVTPAVFWAKRQAAKRSKGKKIRLFLTAHDYSLVSPYSAHGYFRKGVFIPFHESNSETKFFFRQVDPRGHFFSWLKKAQWYLAFSVLRVQRQIDLVLSPSLFLGKIIKRHYPYLPVVLLRNPLIKKGIYTEGELPSARPQDPVLKIIYLGRVAQEKGVDKLLLLLKNLQDKNGTLAIELDIYGMGAHVAYIQKIIAEYKLSFAHYKGFLEREKLKDTLAQYDVFVMSSIWYENAPLTIVEAASQGLKLLVPDLGGMKELAQVCGNAFYYHPDDADSLMRAIDQCRQPAPLAIKTVLQNIEDNFDLLKYIQRLSAFYHAESLDCNVFVKEQIKI